jgi:cysteine synthase A
VNQFDKARLWIAQASTVLAEERAQAPDTPLLALDIPEVDPIRFYLKDEAAHPSGSLKHRLAHALLTHAICSGAIGPETVIVEASSGSTAISIAWFARMLGLQFVAVVPALTAPAKIEAIRSLGGEVSLVEPGKDICVEAADIAKNRRGYFINQFARALEATDWRDSNVAESLFSQLALTEAPVRWVVVGAGTGGTSATIGRYICHRPEFAAVRLCVVDPEESAFFRSFVQDDPEARGRTSKVVEGIGRGRVEPGFSPLLIDRMISVTDDASIAASHWLRQRSSRIGTLPKISPSRQ